MRDPVMSLEWREATLALEGRLRQLTGQAPERLDMDTIKSDYPKRHWSAGWRVRIEFSDGVTRRMDVLATRHFPLIPVRTALVDHPESMTWPHVESDGILCLLPNMSETDPDDPGAVAENLLIRSCRLIEELLQGDIVERDFREEFLTYWGYRTHKDGSGLFSLIEPTGPSRQLRLWHGEGIDLLAEDEAALRIWVERRFGARKLTTMPAVLLWFDQPLLPSEYPEKAADVRELALRLGPESAAVLDDVITAETEELVVVLAAPGRGGIGLVVVRIPNPKKAPKHPYGATDPLTKGYRQRSLPRNLMTERFFGATPVVRGLVQRADAAWVHGRGQDPRSIALLGKSVIVFGCGSVGAPVASALVQAGVGRLTLVDDDRLSWPNVGRHPLGATAVEQPKAVALASRLQNDYPHLQIDGICADLATVVQTEPELLASADLIIATTGNWAAESYLNRWHVEQGRHLPILYGWTEAHACAGHAVVVGSTCGCFKCHIGPTGAPDFHVAEWPDGPATLEEPACGAHYQPYGPIELAYVNAMIAETALNALLEAPRESYHRGLTSSGARLAMTGGRWNGAWVAEYGTTDSVRIVTRPWPATANCPVCNKAAVEVRAA